MTFDMLFTLIKTFLGVKTKSGKAQVNPTVVEEVKDPQDDHYK